MPVPAVDAGIVAGSHIAAAQELRPLEEGPELQVAVAVDAGVGGEALAVAGRELPDDLLPERIREVEDIVRDAQAEGGGAGVLHILQAAAGPATGEAGVLVLIELHGAAHAVVARVPQQLPRRAGVHAAAHGQQDFGFLHFRHISS